jgi:hypothetical protein
MAIEKLHSYNEYIVANRMVENMSIRKKEIGLSEKDSIEFRELAERVKDYRIKNFKSHIWQQGKKG